MSLLNLYKCSSSFGVILMFLICILLTSMTIYGWTNENIFWSDQKTKELILGLMATVSFLLLMISIIAIAGIVRKLFCLIFCLSNFCCRLCLRFSCTWNLGYYSSWTNF